MSIRKRKACPKCTISKTFPISYRFCPFCGTKLQELIYGTEGLSKSEAIDEVRKTLQEEKIYEMDRLI
jgi:hypothetical protein